MTPIPDGHWEAGYISLLTRARWALISLLAGKDAIVINISNSEIYIEPERSFFLGPGSNNTIYPPKEMCDIIHAALGA